MNHQSILDSFCSQLAALQNNIATRPEDPGMPTEKDITMQVRLMSCIDKMSKVIARLAKEAAKREEETSATEQPEPPVYQVAATQSQPPLPAETLQDCRYILNLYENISDYEQIQVRGKKVDTMWLMYNVLQSCRPAGERRYIADQYAFHRAVNKDALRQEVAAYLQEAKAA